MGRGRRLSLDKAAFERQVRQAQGGRVEVPWADGKSRSLKVGRIRPVGNGLTEVRFSSDRGDPGVLIFTEDLTAGWFMEDGRPYELKPGPTGEPLAVLADTKTSAATSPPPL